VADEDGQVLTREEAEWHQKVALFTDENEDTVSIVGSPNESFKALDRNRESITLSRKWVENPDADWDERQRIESQRREFEMLWSDNSPDAKVITIPEALKEDLLRDAPETKPDSGDEPAVVGVNTVEQPEIVEAEIEQDECARYPLTGG